LLRARAQASINVHGDVEGSAGSCAGGTCFTFSEGCTIGCEHCSPNGKTCGKTAEPTLPQKARTYLYRGAAQQPTVQEDCGQAPWCAPGKAGIRSPCGVVGGSDQLDPNSNSGWVIKGTQLGQDGRMLKELPQEKPVWKAGSAVNVSWALNANHGGGYQYRLAKKSLFPSEAEFQRMPIEFASSTNFVKFCDANKHLHVAQKCCSSDADLRKNPPCEQEYKPCSEEGAISFEALDVSEGTTPPNSVWRRNPIPPCKGASGGCCGDTCGAAFGTEPTDYQFAPPGLDITRNMSAPFVNRTANVQRDEYIGGFGMGGGCDWDTPTTLDNYQSYVVLDELRVPRVPAGDYILSWRWDVEQGNQIWSSCSDITIR
jgi:hypothetical protein